VKKTRQIKNLQRFRARWIPVRVKKTRQIKNRDPVLILSAPEMLWWRVDFAALSATLRAGFPEWARPISRAPVS